MAHLITGYAGYEHIRSADDGAFNAAFIGSGQYVMEIGNQFAGSIIDNNTVRILDGDGLMYGRHFRIEPNSHEDLTVETGSAGLNRYDLVCMTYEKDSGAETETVRLEVIKGTAVTGTPTVPEHINGNILEGAMKNQMPLYLLKIEGIYLLSVTPLFETIPTYRALAERYRKQFEEACETHLESLGVLDTMAEVNKNTSADQLAGALAVKELDASKAPNGHASSATTYGAGNASDYGHVKLSDAVNSNSDASSGTAASPKAVKSAYDLANSAKTNANSATKLATARTVQTNLASTSAASFDGSANISPGVKGTLPLGNGGTGATTAATARSNLGVPPTNHATSGTTYGIGTGSNYGHVKLSDSTNLTSGESVGVAATPKAVQTAYIKAENALTVATEAFDQASQNKDSLLSAVDVVNELSNNVESRAKWVSFTKNATLPTLTGAYLIFTGHASYQKCNGLYIYYPGTSNTVPLISAERITISGSGASLTVTDSSGASLSCAYMRIL